MPATPGNWSTPASANCYDYVGHVLFTWYAPELWHRFTVVLRRLVARHCRDSGGNLGVRVAYVKVVEMQRRAVPHFHTVIRLDNATARDGLFEFRIRHKAEEIVARFGDESPVDRSGAPESVLLRVFVHFYGQKVVLLLGGYDKGRAPSPKRQQAEIKEARKLLAQFKERQRRRRV